MSLSRLDTLVGDLLDILDRSGKADNTIVIYIGDHGADMLRGKRTCYEGGLRVPMLVRCPGKIIPQVRNELVSTIDLMPTLLTAAGVEPPSGLPGSALQPLFKPGEASWRTHYFAEYHTHAAAPNYYPQRSVRTERYKLIENLLPGEVHPDYDLTLSKLAKEAAKRKVSGGLDLTRVIAQADSTVKQSYERMRQPSRYELSDLVDDPHEFHDLSGSTGHAAVLRELQTALSAWREETKDPLLDPANLERLRVLAIAMFSAGSLCHGVEQPNVLMIVVDDMNDWVGCLGGHPQVQTPNIDRLAQRGLLFTNAHVPAPVCNPCRVSVMTGRRPGSTGIYANDVVWHEAFPGITSLPGHFKANGYHVVGGGKVNHHMPGFNRRSDWHDYFDQVFDSHYQDQLARGQNVKSFQWPGGFPLNKIEAVRTFSKPPQNANEFDWGPFDLADHEMGDGKLIEWAMQFLAAPPKQPFFLAAGIYRPHLPFYAPRKYFDMYPLDQIILPEIREDDCGDLPSSGKAMAANRRGDLELVIREGKYREMLQAYLANISFADALIGQLLDALDASPAAKNTIIVLWSDHGWHLGEKQHLHKFTLWERSTRVPYIIVAPGVTSASVRCARPVGLIDTFRTLNELCSLPSVEGLDGASLVPLLKEPDRMWGRPALTTHGRGNHALRTERWRYVRYADGGEELYDHSTDPNEWHNLAAKPEFAAVKTELARSLPQTNATALGSKNTPRRNVE